MERYELEKYKEKLQYNLAQLELDYYQHQILSKLYKKFNTIYFKGGTCLQKCYGIKRFSEDLDFNYTNISISQIIEFIEKSNNTKVTNLYKTQFGTSFSIKLKGILYSGDPRTLCKISFDFRENDIYQKPMKKIIRPIYSDLNTYFLLSLNEDEILAEKVRAIITRYKARDVFDLNELLLNGTKVNFDLINKKLKTYDLSFNNKLFKEKIEEKEKIYVGEMSKLVKIYPTFKECKNRILTNIKQSNLQ